MSRYITMVYGVEWFTPTLNMKMFQLIYVMETPRLAIYSHLTYKKYDTHGNTT